MDERSLVVPMPQACFCESSTTIIKAKLTTLVKEEKREQSLHI